MANRTKYNVSENKEKRTYNGIVFDSEIEMKYYRDVVIPQMESGEIVACERQKKYILQPAFKHNGKKIQPIEYKADFYIKYKNNKEIVVDTKGCPDSVALIKRKMFWHVFPELDYVWMVYVKKFGGWIEYDDCKRLRKEEKKEKARRQKDEQNKEK